MGISLAGAEVVVADVEDGRRGRPVTVRRRLLGPVDLEISEPSVALIGANGSGKSTLLGLLNGLVTATAGTVSVDGLDPAADGAAVRRRVGYAFSDPAAQLVMPTPREDVELSLRRTVRDRAERRERAIGVLDELGIADLADRSVYELSGGQRQLVALAAVLAVDPQILLLDEPTTLLDLRNRELLRRTLRELIARRGIRIVCATHDLELAGDCQRALLLDDGLVVGDGEPAAIIADYRVREGAL